MSSIIYIYKLKFLILMMAEEAKDEFGEQEEEQINENSQNPGQPPIFTRVRLPRTADEVIGVIDQRVGGIRMMVRCTDGKTRNCRVKGKLKKSLWLRPGDVVLVELWEFDKDRGDIIFKYNPSAIQWLKNKGYLKSVEAEF